MAVRFVKAKEEREPRVFPGLMGLRRGRKGGRVNERYKRMNPESKIIR